MRGLVGGVKKVGPAQYYTTYKQYTFITHTKWTKPKHIVYIMQLCVLDMCVSCMQQVFHTYILKA